MATTTPFQLYQRPSTSQSRSRSPPRRNKKVLKSKKIDHSFLRRLH